MIVILRCEDRGKRFFKSDCFEVSVNATIGLSLRRPDSYRDQGLVRYWAMKYEVNYD
jgi:hypothetical protein